MPNLLKIMAESVFLLLSTNHNGLQYNKATHGDEGVWKTRSKDGGPYSFD